MDDTGSPPLHHAHSMDSLDVFPIEIQIAIFDLLPEGNLSSLAWVLSCGLYHSAIRIPSLKCEFAFGGHDVSGLTGIFRLPYDQPLPGCRFRTVISLGNAFGRQWRQSRSLEHAWTRPSRKISSQYSLVHNASDTAQSDTPTGSAEDDRPALGKAERKAATLDRILDVADSFRASSDWHGSSYNILSRNCNNFTDAFAFALTGKHAPGWLNRAAWIGSNLPCLLPLVIVDTPSADEHAVHEVRYTQPVAQPMLPAIR